MSILDYIQQSALQSLSDAHLNVRSTAGTIITTIVARDFSTCPAVLQKLMSLIDSPDASLVEVFLFYPSFTFLVCFWCFKKDL